MGEQQRPQIVGYRVAAIIDEPKSTYSPHFISVVLGDDATYEEALIRATEAAACGYIVD